MSNGFKYCLIVFIAGALFVPLIQFKLDVFETKALEGGITVAPKPEFKKEDYWNLKWQDDYNKYINDNFGFRSVFVRLINQIRFSLFHTSKAPGVVVGKNNELFIESYIDDYIGRNYVGGSKINATASKIKTLQDSLKSRGIDLIVVFAPGKASFYPELIPDNYLRKKKDSTNYKVYANAFQKNNVNFIDFNKWFFENKTKFKYPVYPKYGTHWNHYGMSLALDSLIKYIEKKQNINIPDFDYSLINYDSDLRGNDYDVGILTNLLFPLEKDVNPYPVFKFKTGAGYKKPDAVVIGDSYWWCLVGDDLPIHFFREDEYWFYNNDVYVRNSKREMPVKRMNLSAALSSKNVIVLMATEATYYMFPYGFVDNAYTLFCNDNSKRYNEIIENMKRTTVWYDQVVEKAKQNNIPLELQMQRDAEYILCEEILKPAEDIEDIMARIRKDPKWMEDIKRKANENNLSVDQQLRNDAQWAASKR